MSADDFSRKKEGKQEEKGSRYVTERGAGVDGAKTERGDYRALHEQGETEKSGRLLRMAGVFKWTGVEYDCILSG